MIENNLPLVSVVVPVYKTERYIKQCVDSIIGQTYKRLQIILVDDGSPDACPQICDEYASSDSRVVVIHKQNGGAMYARKAGLDYANGAYILFVDGDDWLEADAVEVLLARAESDGADCVMFGYVREYEGKSIPNPLFEDDFSYDEAESERLIHRRLVGPLGDELIHPERVDNLVSVCMKLYRTETARRGRIVSERAVGTSEDTVFNLYALEGCRISYVDRCFYHYRKSNAQSITTAHKPELADKWDRLYEIFCDYIEKSGQKEEYEKAFLNRVVCCLIGLGLNEVGSRESIFKIGKKLKSILKKPLYERALGEFDMSSCPLKWKVFFGFCKARCGLLLAIMLKIINKLRSRAAA